MLKMIYVLYMVGMVWGACEVVKVYETNVVKMIHNDDVVEMVQKDVL